jgi:uncharacterized membrane protein
VKQFAVFATLLVWCGILLAGRVYRTGTLTYAFLGWNLFLATIPAFAARRIAKAGEQRRSFALQAAWGLVWLAFLPNAPYIVTDFVHLRPRPPAPLWYDVALLLVCSATGLLLAFWSIAEVQRVVERRFGTLAGWLSTSLVLMLSAFGIYLGRFLRWNSWDVAANPVAVLQDAGSRIIDPFAHPRTLAFTLIYGCSLHIGYVAYLMTPGRVSRPISDERATFPAAATRRDRNTSRMSPRSTLPRHGR